MTRPKSERQIIGTLLGRVFHIDYYLSKGMLFGANGAVKSYAQGAVGRTLER